MKDRFNGATRYEELRLDSEKSQTDIANILEVKRNTYSKWENCINDMPLEKGNVLANFYNTSMDYLLGLSNERNYIPERNDINYELFTKRILLLRKKHNLTQEKLSDKLGFTQRAYAYYENGERIPKTLKLLVMAQFYNVSSDYLLGRSDNSKIK